MFLMSFRFPIYLGLISVAHAVIFYRRSQLRERRSLELEAGLARARLDALRVQLQPHLLFNTLNTIAGLVHEQPDKADAMLTALSELLRMTLESSNEQELLLQREMDFVERYLTLLHARFEERLQFSLSAEAESRAALVPSMLLQPLVENAVEHGLQSKPGGGKVTVRAWREENLLRITVSDDGVGLREGESTRDGIGLGNTRARLRGLYGDKASLTLRNENGVTVEVALPFRTRSEG
jgi:LytS/YehU family sensor histidine kinase